MATTDVKRLQRELVVIFTIVTVTRNDLSGLKRTFASLGSQTCRDVQHIVIDGASTDGSPSWASANQVFPITEVLSEPDEGIYDAMNKGLARARGEVVAFLNSGDCFADPDVLHFAATSYRAERWEWALGMSQMVDDDFVPVRVRSRASYSWRRATFWHYDISQQAVFIQTRIARQLGGFDRRFVIAGDFNLMTRLGRQYSPKQLPRTVALTLAGGVSDRSVKLGLWEQHTVRTEALGLSKPAVIADALWTHILITKTHIRRTARRVSTIQPRVRRQKQGIVTGDDPRNG